MGDTFIIERRPRAMLASIVPQCLGVAISPDCVEKGATCPHFRGRIGLVDLCWFEKVQQSAEIVRSILTGGSRQAEARGVVSRLPRASRELPWVSDACP